MSIAAELLPTPLSSKHYLFARISFLVYDDSHLGLLAVLRDFDQVRISKWRRGLPIQMPMMRMKYA